MRLTYDILRTISNKGRGMIFIVGKMRIKIGKRNIKTKYASLYSVCLK